MRTSLDLPDPLFRHLKARAALEGRTLRELVVSLLERGLTAVYPVALRLGRRVSVKPLAREEYERGDSPLLREVRRSGVAA
jgi:hypothetical protein